MVYMLFCHMRVSSWLTGYLMTCFCLEYDKVNLHIMLFESIIRLFVFSLIKLTYTSCCCLRVSLWRRSISCISVKLWCSCFNVISALWEFSNLKYQQIYIKKFYLVIYMLKHSQISLQWHSCKIFVKMQ